MHYFIRTPSKYKEIYGIKKFWKDIDDIGIEFWSEMPWMPGGKYLWHNIQQYQPIILSAIPAERYSRLVTPGKFLWASKNLTGRYGLIVGRRADKAKFAEGNFLIDDYEQNCIDWQNAGGFAYHYTGDIRSLVNFIRVYKGSFNETR